MKGNNVELIVFSTSYSPLNQKQIIQWMTMVLQPKIDRQQQESKKLFLKILNDTPAIYLS